MVVVIKRDSLAEAAAVSRLFFVWVCPDL